MKIFSYIRPKSKEFFCEVINKTFDYPEIVSFSDFKGLADIWAGTFLYNSDYEQPNADFEEEANDILSRCRTLRLLDRKQAYRQALRYWNGIDDIFSKYQFDYAVIFPVDNYTLDIIDRVARMRGVKTIAFIGTFISEHARISTRGEYRSIGRNVTDEEVEYWVHKLTDVKFLPDSETENVKRNHKFIYKYYIRRKLIENIYYPIKKIVEKDPWNYHYNMFYLRHKSLKMFYNKNFDSCFLRLNEIKFDPEKTVYLPMHLIPEATTDYWCSNVEETNYRKFILDLIEKSDKNITFIVKEHPAMYGKRELSFYEELNSIDNVILLHPMDRSNELLQRVETLVTDNGTVGIESLMRHKRVLIISDNYYYKFHPNAFFVDRITIESLSFPLVEFRNEEFMRVLLEAMFESDFENSRNGIPNSNPDQIVRGTKQYLRYMERQNKR